MVSLQVFKVIVLLVCVTATVHGVLYDIRTQGNGKFKISMVTDSNLQQALYSLAAQSAQSVKALDLSGNSLSIINGAALQQFANLELLNLSSNVFHETVDLGSLRNLRTVDLKNNFMNEVVVGPSVENLYAANNRISRVTCNGPSQGRGKKFDLTYNMIGSLLDLSHYCRSGLVELDLKLNNLDFVEYGDLADSRGTLQVLNLRHNFIFDIKNEQNVMFPKLQTLDFSSNKLTFLGKELEAAPSASWIDFSNNKLVLIDRSLVVGDNITHLNLLGNGFHCGTLKDFFVKYPRLVSVASSTVLKVTNKNKENCTTNTSQDPGPFCCERLPAPFADRLIDMKRKEHALFSDRSSEKEREKCMKETEARLHDIKSMQSQYSLKIDELTRIKQEKIRLEKEHTVVQEKVAKGQDELQELKSELENVAREMELNGVQNLDELQLLEAIVKRYDEMYQEQQSDQNNVIRDWDMYQQREAQLAEENARLRKLNEEADEALANASQTLQDLNEQEQNLEKFLKEYS